MCVLASSPDGILSPRQPASSPSRSDTRPTLVPGCWRRCHNSQVWSAEPALLSTTPAGLISVKAAFVAPVARWRGKRAPPFRMGQSPWPMTGKLSRRSIADNPPEVGLRRCPKTRPVLPAPCRAVTSFPLITWRSLVTRDAKLGLMMAPRQLPMRELPSPRSRPRRD